jgi:hypothetical protein
VIQFAVEITRVPEARALHTGDWAHRAERQQEDATQKRNGGEQKS